ncbi:hypothetical protein E2C01_060116 [Portunus trituberculatus]|uniref:Uncharacterized protein n=1 Tax=Portunus trituberculatus TaxID=210409 RepID=A0A5B7H778_PORTR|nr:hypothetical protein [Portunus trituberculatus]
MGSRFHFSRVIILSGADEERGEVTAVMDDAAVMVYFLIHSEIEECLQICVQREKILVITVKAKEEHPWHYSQKPLSLPALTSKQHSPSMKRASDLWFNSLLSVTLIDGEVVVVTRFLVLLE